MTREEVIALIKQEIRKHQLDTPERTEVAVRNLLADIAARRHDDETRRIAKPSG